MGKKVVVKLTLDTDSPYDREVIKKLKRLKHWDERKEFMVSAMLYYAKSPSFMLMNSLQDLERKVFSVTNQLERAPILIQNDPPKKEAKKLPEIEKKPVESKVKPSGNMLADLANSMKL